MSPVAGRCWTGLFQHPVLVEGFLVPRRKTSHPGIEMSLDVIAELTQCSHAINSAGNVYIKGFNTMLVAEEIVDDVIVWHALYRNDGERISHIDYRFTQKQSGFGGVNLRASRHVVGWCSEAKIWAGNPGAEYSLIRRSGLTEEAIEASWRKIPISFRKRPVLFKTEREGNQRVYRQRLEDISRQFALLYDVRTRRAWLIDGATALVHLLRTCLKDAETGMFGDDFLLTPGSLEETSGASVTARSSSIRFLKNERNLQQELFEAEDLKGKILQILDNLEQMVDLHPGTKSKAYSRGQLQGFEFMDAATLGRDSTITGVVTKLTDKGRVWVDFVREIRAFVLFGNAFGELIRPTRQEDVCRAWGRVPVGNDYLAVSVSDINYLLKDEDSLGEEQHRRLTRYTYWHNPVVEPKPCQCSGEPGDVQCDKTQVLLPHYLFNAHRDVLGRAPQIHDGGALIFGYSHNFPLRWFDFDNAEIGTIETGSCDDIHPQDSRSDSYIGSSETTSIAPPSSQTSLSDRVQYTPPQASSRTGRKILDPDDYRIVWFAPLEIEVQAALHMLDNEHEGEFTMSPGDDYIYHAGDMCGHNIVIAPFPAGREYGTGAAAALAAQVKKFFRNLWFGLLVGVAAGIPSLSPSPGRQRRDIRLGDVLVALSVGESPATLAYGLGKRTEDGLRPLRHGHVLPEPESIVLAAIGKLKSSSSEAKLIMRYYDDFKNKGHRGAQFADPGQAKDNLFEQVRYGRPKKVSRIARPASVRTRVWYGTIGSGDELMRDAAARDKLLAQYDIIGLEMEAAGMMSRIPVGVVRGVCDYADAHKNKDWQPYAAAMAAAYAKAVINTSEQTVPAIKQDIYRKSHPLYSLATTRGTKLPVAGRYAPKLAENKVFPSITKTGPISGDPNNIDEFSNVGYMQNR
ncbi:hypothetical protein PG995_007650 [Apiospora arundinis]